MRFVTKVVLFNFLLLFVFVFLIEFLLRSGVSLNLLKPYTIGSGQFKKYNLDLGKDEAIKKFGVDPTSVPSEYQQGKSPELPEDHSKLSIDYSQKDKLQKAFIQKSPTDYVITTDVYFNPPFEKIKLYSAEYRLNSLNQRKVEFKNPSPSKFFLALGDSFTFGEGTTTGYDYPSQLQKKLSPQWSVYNLGRPGYGTNDFLDTLLTFDNHLNDVNEASGVAVWFFIEDHFERFLCTYQCANIAKSGFYNYKSRYEVKDGILAKQGSQLDHFNSTFQLSRFSEIYKVIKASKYFNYSADQLETLALSFVEIKKIIERKKQVTHFYVMFTHDFPQKEEFIRHLKQNNIEIWDFAGFPFYLAGTVDYPVDRHPTKTYYWLLTELITKKLTTNTH